jgi:hypothetical protein
MKNIFLALLLSSTYVTAQDLKKNSFIKLNLDIDSKPIYENLIGVYCQIEGV